MYFCFCLSINSKTKDLAIGLQFSKLENLQSILEDGFGGR